MGANPTQATGVTVFLVAFVLIAAALASGGSVLLAALGVAGLIASGAIFLKCKPWEHEEQ